MLNNHFTNTTRRVCAIVATCVTFCGYQTHADVLMVDTRAELDAQDFIDWGLLGPAGTDVGTAENGAVSFSIQSNLNLKFDVSKPTDGSFKRLDQEPPAGGGWSGNFAPGAALLSPNSAGPLLIEANEGMSSIGFQIQPDTTGSVAASQPFTVRMDVFDKDGNSLGTFFNSGTSNTNADNSAVFIGVRSDIPNIAAVMIRTDSTANGGNFAINSVSVAYARHFKFTGEGIYGMTVFRELVLFDSADPGTILSKVPITGLTDQNNSESVRRIDFRPATEELYGVGNAPGGIYRLYKINPDTGAASQIGGTLQPVPGSLGMNFEPTSDQLRIISDAEQNFRYNPATAALVANDGNLAYASGDPGFGTNPNVVTLSYTNSVPAAANTTLYVIDTARDVLAIQQPNSGVLTTVGPLGIDVPSFVDPASLEISPQSGKAYLSLINPGTQQSHLYTVNLTTGAATLVGQIGENSLVRSITTRIKPQAEPTPRPTPTPVPSATPKAVPRTWVAGRDLAEHEREAGASEKVATNALYPTWSYGYRATVNGTDFTPFPESSHTNVYRTREALEGWSANEGVVVVNTGSEPVQFFTGTTAHKPAFPDQLLIEQPSTFFVPVVRWTAPSDGDYRISAKWVDLQGTDDAGSVHVVIDGQQVMGNQADLSFSGQTVPRGGSAVMPTFTFRLQSGARVDFIVSAPDMNRPANQMGFNAYIVPVPKVTVSSPAAEYAQGQEIPINVQVDHKYPIASVNLRLNLENDSSVPAGSNPYQFVLRNRAPGTYKVSAVVRDDQGVETVSEQFRILVNPTSVASSGAAEQSSKFTSQKTSAATASGRVLRCTQNGRWNDAATWGNQGVPGRHDHAIIPAGREVELFGGPFEVNNLDISGVLFVGPTAPFNPRLSVFGTMIAERALLGRESGNGGSGLPAFIIESSGKLVVTNGITQIAGGYLFNHGRSQMGEQGVLTTGPGVIVEHSGGLRIQRIPGSNQPGLARLASLDLKGGVLGLDVYTQLKADGIISRDGAGIISRDGAGIISRDGAGIISRDGAGIISRDGAGLIGADGASLTSTTGAAIVAAGAGNLVGADGASIVAAGAGNLIGADGASIVAAGAGNLRGPVASAKGAVTQRELQAETEDAEFRGLLLEGGSVSGNLNIVGNVLNRGAFILPGESAGLIKIDGNYTQEAAGTLLIEVGGTGTNPLQFDQLAVTGTANLGGNLIVKTIDGFTPQSGDNFAPITYAAVNGQFDSVTSNAQISFGADGATMQVSGPNPPAPKALNIATRMRVESGDNVLIAGFIITGNQPKKVLIRGIGPSLPVSGALADTTLDLDAGTFVNDDWKSDQEQAIRDTTIPPSSDLESAIVATLDPGAHTAVLRGKDGTTGIGLVEVYDLESGEPAHLANIATRGLVQTGDDVMIGGFIIGGNYPAKVLIRAIGPSLAVDGKLQDPTLELVDSNGSTISNDDWRTSQEAEIVATTIPPADEKESAIVATLVPGAYTAIVRGKDNTTGIALVEGYNLQ